MEYNYTVVYPVSDRSDGQSAFEHVFFIFSQGHGSRVTTITPTPNCCFRFVNKGKSFLEITVNQYNLFFWKYITQPYTV